MNLLQQPFALVGLVVILAGPAAPCSLQHACDGARSERLPDGRHKLGGALVGDLDGVSYAIEKVCRGKELWLRLQHRLGDAGAWVVLTELKLPRLRKNEEVVFGIAECKRRGSFDSEIIGIVRDTGEREFLPVVRAWRVDRRAGGFAELSADDIECSSYSHGL